MNSNNKNDSISKLFPSGTALSNSPKLPESTFSGSIKSLNLGKVSSRPTTFGELFTSGFGVRTYEEDLKKNAQSVASLIGAVKDLEKQIKILKDEQATLKDKQYSLKAEQKKEIDEQKNVTKELTQELKKDKHNLIGIMGIFVGIFTFMSVEIQILKFVTDFSRLAGLSMIFFSGIAVFVLTLFVIAEGWVNKTYKTVNFLWYIFLLIVLVGGIMLIVYGDHNNPAVIQNNSDFIELEDKVDIDNTIISDLNTRIEKLEEKREKGMTKTAQQNK